MFLLKMYNLILVMRNNPQTQMEGYSIRLVTSKILRSQKSRKDSGPLQSGTFPKKYES